LVPVLLIPKLLVPIFFSTNYSTTNCTGSPLDHHQSEKLFDEKTKEENIVRLAALIKTASIHIIKQSFGNKSSMIAKKQFV
jgi:hypothetical protein